MPGVRAAVLRAVRQNAKCGYAADLVRVPGRGHRNRLKIARPPDRIDGVTTDDLVQPAAARESGGGKIKKFLRLVMIEHSIFALLFAYTAALTAMWRQTRSVHWVELLLITVAMVSARTVA